MAAKTSNFFKRLLASIILILFALTINYIGNVYFLITIIAVLLILLIEYYRLFSIDIYDFSFLLNFVLMCTCVILTFKGMTYLSIIPLITGIITSAFDKKYWIIRVFSYFYLAIPASLIVNFNINIENGKILIIWIFIIIWSCDIFGYLFGKILKGPKLMASISPNKTWSGFIASIIFASFSSAIYGYLLNLEIPSKAFKLGFIVSLFAVAGDLFESYLKRKNNKKDVSNLIPGHGGLLDRLDSFLFAIVIFWVLIFFKES